MRVKRNTGEKWMIILENIAHVISQTKENTLEAGKNNGKQIWAMVLWYRDPSQPV